VQPGLRTTVGMQKNLILRWGQQILK
jgi:hypothetical protein